MDFKVKYLKYKNKYLELKKQIGGIRRRGSNTSFDSEDSWSYEEQQYERCNPAYAYVGRRYGEPDREEQEQEREEQEREELQHLCNTTCRSKNFSLYKLETVVKCLASISHNEIEEPFELDILLFNIIEHIFFRGFETYDDYRRTIEEYKTSEGLTVADNIMNEPLINGITPFIAILLSRYTSEELIDRILDYDKSKLDLNGNSSKDGISPLHHLAISDMPIDRLTMIIDLLLVYGLDINKQDKDGNTPLHFALLQNKPDIALLLFNKGAERGIQNMKGETPLLIAASKGYSNFITGLASAPGPVLGLPDGW